MRAKSIYEKYFYHKASTNTLAQKYDIILYSDEEEKSELAEISSAFWSSEEQERENINVVRIIGTSINVG